MVNEINFLEVNFHFHHNKFDVNGIKTKKKPGPVGRFDLRSFIIHTEIYFSHFETTVVMEVFKRLVYICILSCKYGLLLFFSLLLQTYFDEVIRVCCHNWKRYHAPYGCWDIKKRLLLRCIHHFKADLINNIFIPEIEIESMMKL